MSNRLLRTPLFVVIALLAGGATAFGMPYIAHTAPNVTITSKPTAWSSVAGPTFKWSKSGTVTTTTCQIDGGSFSTCGTSKTYSGLAAGSHTFAVKVTGGGPAVTKSYTWQIDLTDPVAPDAVAGGSLSWRNTNAPVIATGGSDAESGLKGLQYRKSTDGGTTWGTVTSGATATVSLAGTSIVQFRSIDVAGNVSAWFPAVAGADNTVKIDKSVPTNPTVSGGGTATAWQNVASVTITPAGSTDGGGSGFSRYQYRYSTDGGLHYGAATDGPNFTISTEGNNFIQFHAVDNAGNVSAWVTGYARIDRTVPTAPNLVGGGSNWKSGTSTSVQATGSTDAGSGISGYQFQTSLDGTTWGTITAGPKATITTQGHSFVRFRAVDKAGYFSAWSDTDVWFDGADPSTPTVNGGSLSWTNAASVTVTASGSTDAASGLFGYQYSKSTNGGNTWSFPNNGTSVVVTAPGETLIQFRSTDNAGRHSAMAPTTATAGSTVRIDRIAPTDPVVTNSSTTWKDVASVTVTAGGSTDSGGAALNRYERQTSTDGGTTWSSWTTGASAVISAEGETLVNYVAVDGAGNRSNPIQATVRIDRSAPTNPSVTGGSLTWTTPGTYEVDGAGSTDAPGSGVTGYQYRTSTNGGAWSGPTDGAAVFVTAEGETLVQFRAQDTLGHFSAWAPAAADAGSTVRIDSTPPNVPTVTGGSASWRTTSPWTVTASATDPSGSGIAGYEYETSPDGTTWSNLTSGNSAAISTEGTTYVHFRAIDNSGNVSAWSTSAQVKLDSAAPTVPTLTGGSGSWFTTSPQSVSASGSTDATSGGITYRYQTSPDNTNWSAATTASSVSVSTQGTTYVRFAAVDAAGNASAYSSSVSVKIDTVAPSVPTLTGGGASWILTSPASVTASGSTDATSGGVNYQYQTSTDGVTWPGSGTAGSSASISTQGTTYVRFRALDAAGNASAYSSAVTVKLDSVAPSVPTLTGGGSSWFNTAQTVSASGSTDATSGGVTYRYQTSPDNTNWSAATTASSVAVSTLGTTYVRFAAADAAGNVSAYSASVTVKYDNVLPTAPSVSGGSATCSTTARTISASGSTDANSGFLRYEYRTSTNAGSTWSASPYTAGSSKTFSTTGTTYIQFRSVDNAGNVSAWAPASIGAANEACIT